MLVKLKRITVQLLMGANLSTILLMLFIGYSDRFDPTKHQLLANAGLVFPVVLVVNFAFLVFWLCTKKRVAWLPFVGYVVCYGPIRAYCPVNIPQDVPPQSVKVMSYNVWSFAGWERHANGKFPILEYIKAQHPDLLCLQEAMTYEIGQARVDSVLDKLFAYKDTLKFSAQSDVIAVYSKYPILAHERIAYPSRGNLSGAFYIKMGRDTVLVINNHLETTGLSNEDKREFRSMMKGKLDGSAAKRTSYRLIDKLGEASSKRAVQANAVAKYVNSHLDHSIILCGDFNDPPISYAHHTIGQHLTDCYIAAGNGPGVSYHKAGMYVRIDHIMVTPDWKPYRCVVDNRIKTSDHYPIICWMKREVKP